ncbi:MAG TPA: hypothetical protein VFS60_16290 [Thermoanaerobaculia bacterium]|nr:hypothetical protein [Thermoanaerobaculia bacterium]
MTRSSPEAGGKPASPVLLPAVAALVLLAVGGWMVTRAATSSNPTEATSPVAAASPVPGSREAIAGEAARIEDEPELALAASVYSFPSSLIPAAQASALLAAVRAADPERELLVLADPPQRQALAAAAAPLRVRLLETGGGPYSPWPRDPFSFARTAGGAVRVVVRPNLQPGREADGDLGRELVEDLPPDLARAWGGVRWSVATVPFHNGQVLLTRDAAWVTLHTFEPRALQLLGVARVPVESFGTAAGIDAYVAAVRRAADELATLYGRPVRFVHPLPPASAGGASAVTGATATELMRRIGGGAGYDLDSLVTFLPARDGRAAALVADLAAGQKLLADAPASELTALTASYDLAAGAEVRPALAAEAIATEVRRALAVEAASPRGRALASFLDLVAEHLAAQGLRVARLPLLLVPTALLRGGGDSRYPHFLLGWNNVVVETRQRGVRAEGFAALLPSGDRRARAAFDALGARLDLLPPLVESVVRNGGYRCASNHLRQPAPPGPGV